MVATELLTIDDLAKHLRISPSAALRLIQAKKIHAINVSAGDKKARYRIPASAVRDFIGDKAAPQAPPQATAPLPKGTRQIV